jgi:hypothetical protein
MAIEFGDASPGDEMGRISYSELGPGVLMLEDLLNDLGIDAIKQLLMFVYRGVLKCCSDGEDC